MTLLIGGIMILAIPIAIFCMLLGFSSRLDDMNGTLRAINDRLRFIEKNQNAQVDDGGKKETANARRAAEIISVPAPPAREFTPPEAPAGEIPAAQAQAVFGDAGAPAPAKPAGETTPQAPLIENQRYDEPPAREKPLFVAIPAQEPSWIEIQTQRAKTWLFSEGNVWVTIGVLLCIAGFGLLFSYAAQMKWISLEARLAVAALTGAGMTAFGWKMRDRRRTYALILQGGGCGVIYVALVAGAKLGPIAPPAAIAALIGLSALTAFLAVRQDFEPLALFALLGGYASPIIVSTGSSNFVALFSIYSLLNLEILIINIRRDWKKARWGGMMASCAVGAAWGFMRWKPMLLISVEPFLILYFLNFAAAAMIPLASGRIAGFVKPGGRAPDIPMTVSLPFIFLALQMKAAEHTAWGVPIACVALGAFYLALAFFTRRGRDKISGVFLAFGVTFLNLAIPFAFSKAAASCLLAAEGALLTAFSDRLGRRAKASGTVLQICAFLIYVFAPFIKISHKLYDPLFKMNGFLDWQNTGSSFPLTALIFAASAFCCCCFTERDRNGIRGGMKLAWGFSAYGAMWWTLAAAHAAAFTIRTPDVTVMLFLCAGACAAYIACGKTGLEPPIAAALPPVLVLTIFGIFKYSAISVDAGTGFNLIWLLFDHARQNNALNWIAVTAMLLAAMYSYRNAPASRRRMAEWGFVLFAAASYTSYIWRAWALAAASGPGKPSDLPYLAYTLPALAFAAIFADGRGAGKIGMNDYRSAGTAACWALMAAASPQFLNGLPAHGSGIAGYYIPFISPLELGQIIFLFTAWLLLSQARETEARRIGLTAALPAAAFLWLNCVAARAAFHYFGEAVRWGTLGGSPHFQAIIAILWGTAALLLIYGGKRLTARYPWFLGAGLLALDIIKLLMFDLRNSATIIRIVAFLAMGGFFLLAGWMAPLPPKRESQAK